MQNYMNFQGSATAGGLADLCQIMLQKGYLTERDVADIRDGMMRGLDGMTSANPSEEMAFARENIAAMYHFISIAAPDDGDIDP
jgi:hypothetical protein